MKIDVFQPKHGDSQEKVIYLGLVPWRTSGYDVWYVDLAVIDPITGKPYHRGSIARIYGDGTMVLINDIDPRIGLALDSSGRIQVQSQPE